MLEALATVFFYATDIILFVIFVWAIMSWLLSFEVINRRNRFVAVVWSMLDGLARPIVGWVPRQIRYLGGVDISPIVLFLIIIFLRALVGNLLAGRLL